MIFCNKPKVYLWTFPLGVLFVCKIGKSKCLTLINNPWFLYKKKYKVAKVKAEKQPESNLKWQRVSQLHEESKRSDSYEFIQHVHVVLH